MLRLLLSTLCGSGTMRRSSLSRGSPSTFLIAPSPPAPAPSGLPQIPRLNPITYTNSCVERRPSTLPACAEGRKCRHCSRNRPQPILVGRVLGRAVNWNLAPEMTRPAILNYVNISGSQFGVRRPPPLQSRALKTIV